MRKIRTILAFCLIVITIGIGLHLIAPSALAVPAPTSTSTQGFGCGGGFGPIAEFLCNTLQQNDPAKSAQATGNKLNAVLSAIISFITIIAALWFLIQFITAGLAWIGSGGDKTNIENARNKIMNSVIGLIIVVLAWVLAGVIGLMLGLDILNPGAALQNIGF